LKAEVDERGVEKTQHQLTEEARPSGSLRMAETGTCCTRDRGELPRGDT